MLRNQWSDSVNAQTRTPDRDDDSILFDDVNVDIDVDVDEMPSQKPHFLDYDAAPPADFDETFNSALSLGSDKKKKHTEAQRDFINHVSSSNEVGIGASKTDIDESLGDFELIGISGYTKKEFTQDDNTLHLKSHFDSMSFSASDNLTNDNIGLPHSKNAFDKPKHFLDENPIPPDYMFESGTSKNQEMKQTIQSLPAQKMSVREQQQLSTLTRFLENQTELTLPNSLRYRVPKEGDSFDSRYSSLHMTSSSEIDVSAVDPLGPKVECVYSLLSMLGSNNPMEMSKKFYDLSRNPETSATLRRSGCVPLLVQMIHSDGEEESAAVRKCAGLALHNVIMNSSHPDDKTGRREIKVLRLLDQIIEYCNFLKTLLQSGGEAIADDSDRHPLAAMSSLMKVSFDEEHRHAMCELGALQAIPSLVHLDHAVHGPRSEDQCCNSLRRYALMALTNLTFGDENNKALLCSQKLFMEALVAQLNASAPDDLLQVTASVLRNLSWRADSNMKATLNEIGTVTALAQAAMKNKNENTLKAILSALWNLSAHCSTNRAEFCAVDGALAFLVKMLTYEGPSKTLKIIENAGGILRNVSSHIAVCEHYRQILREHNCLAILLQQLKSESLTVVSNSCGTLWNLSARCPEDQKFLWDNGAVPMLRSLIHSKHAMISEGSSSALKNLLNFNRSTIQNQNQNLDPIARSMGLKKLPTLHARKQKALEQELKEKEHVETCDNLDAVTSNHNSFTDKTKELTSSFDQQNAAHRRYPLVDRRISADRAISKSATRLTRSAAAMLTKSESGESVFSAKSDSAYENVIRSRSASDENRKTIKNLPFGPPRTAFAIQADMEATEEQPIDYSVKYNENLIKAVDDNESLRDTGDGGNAGDETATGANYAAYQETDLDQPTDFSLRYAENQSESDVDVVLTESIAVAVASTVAPTEKQVAAKQAAKGPSGDGGAKQVNNSNEILLILVQDSIKCYQTEDTPYVISNAASVTDLRQSKLDSLAASTQKKERPVDPQPVVGTYGSVGTYTPEKPTNYCEEGTPGYFSRYDSLNSLDEESSLVHAQKQSHVAAMPNKVRDSAGNFAAVAAKNSKTAATDDVTMSRSVMGRQMASGGVKQHTVSTPVANPITGPNCSGNSAQETPLMFSRHSSMDSLIEEEIVSPCCDDKSSVVSDFSRLASGVISPSEIPDSPSQQSVPQSPRRNSVSEHATIAGKTVPIRTDAMEIIGQAKVQPVSIFEDNLNTFHVENTPAQFSCATSLSNFSFLEDESSPQKSVLPGEQQNKSDQGNPIISEGEEDDDVGTNDDDLLLASCINMGMNRTCRSSRKVSKQSTIEKAKGDTSASVAVERELLPNVDDDEPRAYYTEDTPALLSKVGSNSNLSSLCSGVGGGDLNVGKLQNDEVTVAAAAPLVRESDPVGGSIIKQSVGCINNASKMHFNPLEMLRRGGNPLPPYFPLVSNDEMNTKYLVENSPCNFSINSGLSNLTIGSSLVGPAVQLKESEDEAKADEKPPVAQTADESSRMPVQVYRQDSLSSLSIDSNEDDSNLLSQAIAAGCNRPKSNLGFSSASSHAKPKHPSNSFYASQPSIQLTHLATSESSLPTVATFAKQKPRSSLAKEARQSSANGNDSFSSVDDSSDSNDNQSKSLLELCIRTGMDKLRSSRTHYQNDALGIQKTDKSHNAVGSTQSNPNLKLFGLPGSAGQRRHASSSSNRERDRKDERLLLECINTGISKKVNNGSTKAESSRATLGIGVGMASEAGNVMMKPRDGLTGAASDMPKNGLATSAAALELYQQLVPITYPSAPSTTAPGVETKTNGIITNIGTSISTNIHTSTSIIRKSPSANESVTGRETEAETTHSTPDVIDAPRNPTLDDDESTPATESTPETTTSIGCNRIQDVESMSLEANYSLDTSESVTSGIVSKHKDPDLMLKSVERLTLEFVSSAELLRTNGSNNSSDYSNRRNGSISMGGTASHHTWSENTHPNDVSFPSLSVSAPIVGSLRDEDTDDDHLLSAPRECKDNLDEFPNELIPTQPNSLETDTDTLVNCRSDDLYIAEGEQSTATSSSGINFQLGGEVQSAAAVAGTKLLFNNMTNSTIFAIEARALAENLQPKDNIHLDSFSLNSLDLDNIGPPSGMDSINFSGCFQDQTAGSHLNSLQRPTMLHSSPGLNRSPRYPRKSLPANIVAKRALGQVPYHLSGSAESVNSSCNLLDNIKPPSLMDELLDSMISVASIQSEVADCESIATTMPTSHYQTAADNSEFDDNTITLQSCNEFNSEREGYFDEEASMRCETPLPFDGAASPIESTPQQSPEVLLEGERRTLTPKQKRKFAKDRYKTYTIAANVPVEHQNLVEPDEVLRIEVAEISPKPTTDTGSASANRRRTSHERYKTQTIIYGRQTSAPATSVECGMAAEGTPNGLNFIEQSVPPAARAMTGKITTVGRASEPCAPTDADVFGENVEAKPKISGPGEDADKAIRGRKKPAYVSPYSKQYQRSHSQETAGQSIKSKTHLVIATKKSSTIAATQKKDSSEPGAGSTNATEATVVAPLLRQGTFVQDEPTVAPNDVPIIESPMTPPSRTSKLPTTTKRQQSAGKTNSATSKSSSVTAATRKIPLAMPGKRRLPTVSTPQRSNSITSMRVASSAARNAALMARGAMTTPPSRSNSSLNNNSASKIGQTQSRIASIWKRVDEVKQKQSVGSANGSSNLTFSKVKTSQQRLKPLNGTTTAKPQVGVELTAASIENLPNSAKLAPCNRSRLIGMRKETAAVAK